MMRSVAVLVLLSMATWQPAAAEQDHPIAGVISMLQNLKVQSQEEGETEAATYQKFQYWCKRSTRKLNRAIKKEKKAIEGSVETIEGLTGDISTLTEDIDLLTKQIEEQINAGEKAEELRKDANAFYKKEYTNLDETVDAVGDAVEVMEKDGFLQTGATQGHEGPSTDDLMKMDPGKNNPFKKRKVKVYTEHEGGVIETFKGMGENFHLDQLDVHQREANAQNAHDLAKKARDFTIQAAKDNKQEKEDIKADKGSELAKAKEDKKSMVDELAGDEETAEATHQNCAGNTAAWDERSKVREGEIIAMTKAIEILTKVSGVRNPDEHEIPKKAGLVSKSAEDDSSIVQGVYMGASFLQESKEENPKTKAANLLRQAAKVAHNGALEKLAAHIEAYNGPFDKIKGMIQKMIFRLMAEQKDEDDHKNWCDLELEKNTDSKDDKEEKIKMMDIKAAEMDAEIKKTVKKTTRNEQKSADFQTYMEEETALREENHQEITLTIKDAQDAAAAVANAITVLRDFYKESGMIAKEPWEFIQVAQRGVTLPDSPENFDASYTGVTDPKSASDGVLTILEGVAEQFSKMEAEAKLQDMTDQKNYDADMTAKKVELAELKQDTEMKKTQTETLQGKLEALQATLKHVNVENDAVKQYLKDLEPACVSGDGDYSDRKKARDDEITALRKAQTILEDAFRAKSAFLQN